MRVPFVSFLIAICLAFSSAAYADTINFASAPGVAYTYVSGQGALNGTSGTAVATPNGGWGTAISGSQWISISNSGFTNPGEIDFSFSVNLTANQIYSGALSFMADDYANILINGKTIYSGSGSQYSSPITINLISSYFNVGSNTFVIQNINTGGPSGIDFKGSLTGVATTPEPSSLALLGTGLLGAAGVLRRRVKST